MDTPTMKQKIRSLSDKVNNISEKKMFSFDSFKSMSSMTVYIGFSVFIFAILIAIRPEFLYNYSNDHKTKIFSFGKLFGWWISLSFLFVVIIYLYNHQQK